MNECNSFEEAVKRVLVIEKKPYKIPLKIKRKRACTYVSEAMGNTNVPGAITPASYAGGIKGIPPFSKASTDDNVSSIDMRDIGREESRVAKSTNRKPYPLETIIDFIASSGESLRNAQSMIQTSLKKNNVSLTQEQKKVLEDAQQNISTSLGNICKAAKSINTININ